MEDYKPNSNLYKKAQREKENDKKVEKVVKGTVKVKKKSEIRKFKDMIISEDAGDVKSYILMDILIPTLKKAISDIITDGVDMILGTGNKKKKSRGSNYVSYRSYSDSDDRYDRRSGGSRGGFDLDDLEFESRADAEEVFDMMHDLIDNYGLVTVSDLYDLSNLPKPYTGNRYGWTSIRNAEIIRLRGGGYTIKLPRPRPID